MVVDINRRFLAVRTEFIFIVSF